MSAQYSAPPRNRALISAVCAARPGLALALLLGLSAVHLHADDPGASPGLVRHYQAGETVAYTMRGVNQARAYTIRYEARAQGSVKAAGAGKFVEEFSWTSLQVNGSAFPLSPASLQLRQQLSLDPGYTFSIPDLSKVQPMLIGPITDLLTFYADAQLSMTQKPFGKPGDHFHVAYGKPSSWADGSYVVLGEDSIDFDGTFRSVDTAAGVATVVVRHVPPAKPLIRLPAAWMQAPVVAGSPNNWVEVSRKADGTYAAAVGKETFEAVIRISLESGRILSATLDNPIEVVERDSKSASLADCGPPIRYGLRRQISLELDAAAKQ
jgi:hypothetical protein